MSLLEMVSDETYKGFFVDLYVRCANVVAIDMYEGLGYTVYRRVREYYGNLGIGKGGRDEEDAFGMSILPLMDTSHDGIQTCESLSQEIHINALYERTAERCSSVLTLCHNIKTSAYPKNPNRIIHSSVIKYTTEVARPILAPTFLVPRRRTSARLLYRRQNDVSLA